MSSESKVVLATGGTLLIAILMRRFRTVITR